MRIAAAVLCGFFMDLCLGDPDWMPHPVIYMGKAISALEKFLRRRCPDTPKGLLMAGAALAAILPLGSFLMAAAAIYLIVVMLMTWGLKKLERRLARSDYR